MRNKYEKGAFIEWLLMLLAISIVIFGILIPKSGQNVFLGLPAIDSGWTMGGNSVSIGAPNSEVETVAAGVTAGTPNSAFRRSVELSPGNAFSATDPDLEYVSVRNVGSAPVDITGWSLKNAKDQRFIERGGELRSYASDTAYIPQAALILSPLGESRLSDVILQPGETAYIATGKIGIKIPYTITSFKTNKCTGYLGDMPRYYTFAPNLSRQCVRPDTEPGVRSLTPSCQDFIARMPSCHTPELGGKLDGDDCRDCVDGTPDLGKSCVEFIKSHYSYAGCVAAHQGDANFLGSEWRIFLGKPWEMWAASHEVISLYDSAGHLVATYKY